jgi:hypothetical protein
MLKYSKVGVLMAVLAVCGVMASSASAAEWHTNGTKAFSSTPAGASRLVVHPSGNIIACTGSSGTGTINGPTSTAFPWNNAATVQPVFTGCSVSGAAGYAIACGTSELRASGYVGGTTIGTAGGGVTTGTITGIDCTLSIGATKCATITGTVPAHYINPNPIASGAGRLTITTAGQALSVHPITACAGVPTGTGTFGSPGAGSSIQDLTYTVDGPAAPYIYRTP